MHQYVQKATFGLFAAARLFRETSAGCLSGGSTFVSEPTETVSDASSSWQIDRYAAGG